MAYDKRYQLYLDWIGEKALNPGLKKEQFARERLGITDEHLAGEHACQSRRHSQELRYALFARL
jgi:hypothetical protein